MTHPLTHATVTVNGNVYGPRSIVWARLAWERAELHEAYLAVPDNHPDDAPMWDATARVRPRDERYWFVRARSGVFVLRRPGVGE